MYFLQLLVIVVSLGTSALAEVKALPEKDKNTACAEFLFHNEKRHVHDLGRLRSLVMRASLDYAQQAQAHKCVCPIHGSIQIR